ncbi:UNVERIFIED_CONTAM: Tryptophan aminotransferase-related protein 3 [Sesamum radiatum]|uniref:Tryptophan aminotransferase-related protein 3 n=1 Tax=Sesamum radiatum TaxID=300843 RepID=A0AAW2TV14_SESRA
MAALIALSFYQTVLQMQTGLIAYEKNNSVYIGDPLFLEPFWMKNSGRSTVVIPGWHRMSYDYSDNSYISQELEKNIRKLHAITKNAVTDGRYIVFGAGSTQLLNAAVYALSMNMSSPAKVVAEKPFYRWAIVKDKDIYENMLKYKSLADSGTSKDTQLRALKLIKVVLEDGGRGIFNFAYKTMRGRWTKLKHVLSLSKRFKLQEIPPAFCNYSRTVRGASPAFAWLKCAKEEDSNCHKVLHHEANILGREGRSFDAEDHYVRLSLVKSADDFNLLLNRLKELVSKEKHNQTTRSSYLVLTS